MSDSTTVEVTDDLDAFSELMFNPPAEKSEVEPNPELEAEDPGYPPDDTVVEEGDKPEPEGESNEEDDLEARIDDEDDDEEDKTLFKVKPRKSAKERIQELARQRNDATARADALARELAEARAKVEEKPKAQTVVQKVDGPNPEETLEDGTPKYPLGEFDPDYIVDLTRHTIRKETEAINRADAEKKERERIQKAEQELTSSWNEKVKTAVEKLPDLPGKAAELEGEFRSIDPQYGNYLAQTIMSLDAGPEILNYLADNIDEARQIVASGPTRATIALGRLEARFASSNTSNKPKEVTTAAPPPPPRNRGAGSSVGIAADTDDLDAFEKLYFKK